MKKIFIPAISLLLTGWTVSAQAQCYGDCPQPVYTNPCTSLNGCPEEEKPVFADIFDNEGSESYWKNRFRSYRVYPISLYPNEPCDDTGMASAQTVNAHEYQRNVAVSANRGQRMYDSTTYTLTTHTLTGEAYRVNTKGIISGMHNDFTVYTDDLLRPFGEISINDRSYMLLKLGNTGYTLIVDESGRIYEHIGMIGKGNRLYVNNEPLVYSPQYLRIVRAQNTSQAVSDTQLHFDIRYNGIENNMLSFLIYDAASGTTTKRVASPSQGRININGVNFDIIYYTPEYIEYRIAN